MATTAAPHLLDKLVSLTAIRDIEIFEFSLLKTLYEMFHSNELFLLKLDQSGGLQSILRYINDGNRLTTISYDESSIPEIETVLRIAQRLNSPYHSRLVDGYYISAYPLFDARMLNICLITKSTNESSSQDAKLLKGFLQIYRNFCILIDEAQHDQLTGLLNRKNFDENMQRMMSLAISSTAKSFFEDRRTSKNPGENPKKWLAMIDIDHFKVINDTFGHIYGDEVLVWLGQLLKETFMENDLIYRFGGEEFVVITENFSLEDAKSALERFREKVANFNFPQIPQVTVSCGAVQITQGTLAHTLLDQADQAMYFAKKTGRNQVRFYEDLVESGDIQPIAYKTGEIDLF